MKEFMLLIRNVSDHQAAWSEEQHLQFLKKCETYIGKLKKDGRLISAQPLARVGKMVSGHKGAWKESSFQEGREVIVGYYHILAKNEEDAIAIARENPEFEYDDTARVEVRPVKTKEVTTGYEYPNG